ncbi:hypothetical protein [Nocardioides korecus]
MSTPGPTSQPTTWRRVLPWAPWVWSLGLALLLLGPALGRGYVLSYDMVWVPDLTLHSDVFGLGTGLPRAVPSDAVVAVLDEVVPGMLLEKLVLLVPLVLAGAGAARLTDRRSVTAQLVASGVYVWSPFVAERLLIGHWPVLLGYAALPWLVLLARSWRTTGRVPVALWVVLPAASLSASAGVVSAVVLVVFAVARSPRRLLLLAGLLALANAPWVVTGALHGGTALTDPLGARVFALAGEGSVPAPLAALSLGGIWNSEVVPGSRGGVLGWTWLVLLLVLVALGWSRWRRDAAGPGAREVPAYAVCWVVGWSLAVLTWAWPAASGWLGAHVPGAGLLRDGARVLALCAPLLAVVAGHGAARVVERLAAPARPAAAVALLLLPVATMPDVALGWAGRLEPVAYPRDLVAARTVLDRARSQGREGDVLLLPLSSYRAPGWNGGRKVLDPTGRLVGGDVVAGDDLLVSGRRVAGEDPRVRRVADDLRRSGPAARSAALAAEGVGFVLTEVGAGPAPRVAGTVLLRSSGLRLQALRGVRVERPPAWRTAAVAVAWTAYAAGPVLGLLAGLVVVPARARRRRRGAPGAAGEVSTCWYDRG